MKNKFVGVGSSVHDGREQQKCVGEQSGTVAPLSLWIWEEYHTFAMSELTLNGLPASNQVIFFLSQFKFFSFACNRGKQTSSFFAGYKICSQRFS